MPIWMLEEGLRNYNPPFKRQLTEEEIQEIVEMAMEMELRPWAEDLGEGPLGAPGGRKCRQLCGRLRAEDGGQRVVRHELRWHAA